MKERWTASALRVLAGIAALALLSGSAARAAETSPAVVPDLGGQASQEQHELTRTDVDAFLDALVPFLLEREDIAGAVISVVKDGHVLTTKGYGYADVARGIGVDPRSTVFRLASISKLFTWTAVMQQVEQGRLSLDADVNRYLDFRIPDAFGKPVTLRNCLTHTTGFEDISRGMVVSTPGELVPISMWLKDHVPKRIAPPGEVIAYSNYAAVLAAYIVQRVTGEPFEAYLARQVLKPLGMTNSALVQVLPESLRARLSRGYGRASEGSKPFEYFNVAPAGGISSTAPDMARFMLAYLNDGQLEGVRLLSPETVKSMFTRQASLVPDMNGWGLGFYETDRNGMHIVGHGGDSEWFHTDLSLLPQAGVGFFVAFNSAGSDSGGARIARMALFRAFLDRYFPAPIPNEPTLTTAAKDAARVVGFYGISRHGASAMRLSSALSQIEVTANDEGTITLKPFFTNYAGQLKQWHETAPLHYREVGGRASVAFAVDKSGRVSAWTTDEYPSVFVFERITGMKQLGVVRILFPAAAGVLILGILSWALSPLVRRYYRVPLLLPTEWRRWRLAARIGIVFELACIAWCFIVISATGSDVMPPSVDMLLISRTLLAWLAVVGCLACLGYAILLWIRGGSSMSGRFGEALVALAGIYIVWFIQAYALESFNTQF